MTSFQRLIAAAASLASLTSSGAGLLAPLALSLLATGCGDADTQFNVRYAPTFKERDRNGMTVSILGIFREGRMSPETWEDIGPRISSVFGKSLCPIGYDTKLVSEKTDLANAIDDYARADGITDDLLEQLAPAANGDAMLVITVAGRPVTAKPQTAAEATAPPTTQRAMGRGRGGAGPMGGSTSAMARGMIDRNAFEMSASLFSPRDHHSVALLTMGYSGQSGSVALERFVVKLRESFPGLACVSWNMNAPIDPKKIHDLAQSSE